MPIDDDIVEQSYNVKNETVSKKFLFITIALLTMAAFLVAMYHAIFQKEGGDIYGVFDVDKGSSEDPLLVMYNLPEIKSSIKSNNKNEAYILRLRVSLGFGDESNIKDFETLMPRLMDTIVTAVVEATPEELSGAKGMYWLKEEILHRANLVMSPIEISSVSFRNFDVEKIIINPNSGIEEE